MLRSMRWRFIGAAMAAFFAVVLSLLCVINIWNYRSISTQQDTTLELLLEVEDRMAPMPAGQYLPPFATMERYSPEVPYMIRFFSVHYNVHGVVDRINEDYIASITQTEATAYADEVLVNGSTRGYYGNYRYLVAQTQTGTTVLFLNSERELRAAKQLLVITLVIAGACLAVVFALVVLLSRRAILPYQRNLEAQKQFITNASHELKTPLTAIAASADVLAMDDGENEWVRSIQTQTAHMSRLVTDLVTLSRLDEQDPFPLRAEFSLSDLLWEVTEPFITLAQAKQKLYTQQIEDGLTLTGDRAAIGQMVSILLDNAVKYSAPNGRITLCAQRSGRQNVLSISNTCCPGSIPEPSRLFERFYRADEAHTGTVSGTGIGLSIARATVQAHGGSIRVRQEADAICFCVRLPS